MGTDAPGFTPHEALARIADVAGDQASLRSRFEGMTWVLWGLVAALQAMTLGALSASPRGAPALLLVASHLWIVVGVVASVGVWRAASVNFDPGISRARALGFFIGWPIAFAFAAYLVSDLGGDAFRFAIASAFLLLAFAAVNPVRYTPSGRWTAAVLSAAAFVIAALAWVYAVPGDASFAATGTAVGLTWILAGLYALYRG